MNIADWIVRPGVGSAITIAVVYVIRRIRGSERLRSIIKRVLVAAFREALAQVIIPLVASRFETIERKLQEIVDELARLTEAQNALAEAQSVIDLAVKTHMDSEENARILDVEYRQARQAENTAWQASIEAKVVDVAKEVASIRADLEAVA